MDGAMPLYWLVYRHSNQISVVIEPGASLIHARMRASLDGFDEGDFTEGHELDRKMRIAKEMVRASAVASGSEEVVGEVLAMRAVLFAADSAVGDHEKSRRQHQLSKACRA
jgi:hypothetical protein